MKKQYFHALWGPARRSERTPGEEKKRWGPRTQAGNLELAIRDGAVEIVFAFGTPCPPVGRRRISTLRAFRRAGDEVARDNLAGNR